jgi:XTP/dITP diphosphohydrolase
MPKLLLATNNQGKVSEYRALLGGIPFELVSLTDENLDIKVDETEKTMEANARLKAVITAKESKLTALADDSGLEVDALGGEPGVRSARYAGDHASDSDRVNYLLAKLAKVPWDLRTARFRCVIAIATPQGEVELCSGECDGFITFEPIGKQGFGYDPVFYFPELHKTMAELPPEVKNRISHRGRAARKAARLLKRKQ